MKPAEKLSEVLRINDCLRGSSGASGTLCGGGIQGALHLGFEEELVLRGGFQQILDTPIGVQHVFYGSGGAAEAGQRAKDILQLFALGVQDMAHS